MNSNLENAIKKCYEYNGKLTKYEYYELLKAVKGYGDDARRARNALANSKKANYQHFSAIWTRDKYTEDRYAALGTPKVDSFCYLTTACMKVMADEFRDDCYELESLRKFRDEYVKVKHPEDVKAYYKYAPVIVERINQRADSDDIYNKMYSEMILPCVRLLEKKEYFKVYDLYKSYSLMLQKKYVC